MKNLCVGWAQSMLRVWSPLPRLYQRPLGEDSSVLRPDMKRVIRQGRRGWQRRQEGPRANWGLGKREASESSHTSPFQLSPSQGPLLFSRSVVSNSLRPHELQHARPPCPHQLPEFTQTHIHGDRAISSSVVPFSSCPQSLPASESFPMSQLFA